MIDVVLGFKKNECAVCGENKAKLMRYYVIPMLYRKYLPDKFNEEAWRRHDMLPLCKICHFKAQTNNEIFKDELCKKYNIPHYRAFDKNMIKNSKLMRYIKPLMDEKILRNIPKKKKIVLLKNVADQFECKYDIIENENDNDMNDDNCLCQNFENLIKISDDDNGNEGFVNRMKIFYNEYIQNGLNIGKFASENHAKGMIDAFENNIMEFIKLWRYRFVETMKPKYLPNYWNVENTFFEI